MPGRLPDVLGWYPAALSSGIAGHRRAAPAHDPTGGWPYHRRMGATDPNGRPVPGPAQGAIVIDAGNSAARVALARAGRAEAPHRVTEQTVDALAAAIAAAGGTGRPILIGSVVPAWTELAREASDRLGSRLVEVRPEMVPLDVLIPAPERLGIDRLLAAWGAVMRHGAPSIVIDLGTATTVDAVDASGGFRGGAILPGLTLSRDALARGTALLPEVAIEPPAAAIGTDTEAAIRSGVVIGQIGAIRELVNRMIGELGRPRPVVVATGAITAEGWMRDALLAPAGPGLPPIAGHVEPDLVIAALADLGRPLERSA